MERIKPRTLSGFMELLPDKQAKMERFMQILRESYALYGFTPLDTPGIEAAEVLLAKGGGDTEKQIYRFTKGDADLALRFDLTVPLAKYVALPWEARSLRFTANRCRKEFSLFAIVVVSFSPGWYAGIAVHPTGQSAIFKRYSFKGRLTNCQPLAITPGSDRPGGSPPGTPGSRRPGRTG